MVYMNTNQSNNDRLRELVDATGLTQAAALTIFNRGLGPAAYSESFWKALFVRPDSSRYRPLKDTLLAHAEKNFAAYLRKAPTKGGLDVDLQQ